MPSRKRKRSQSSKRGSVKRTQVGPASRQEKQQTRSEVHDDANTDVDGGLAAGDDAATAAPSDPEDVQRRRDAAALFADGSQIDENSVLGPQLYKVKGYRTQFVAFWYRASDAECKTIGVSKYAQWVMSWSHFKQRAKKAAKDVNKVKLIKVDALKLCMPDHTGVLGEGDEDEQL
ncbi:hypothetical protein ACM66B_002928 [Microbotryomycetes sp. NB124-2]